ncbi:MAG: tetratricopeptide repeat protein [Armatimonadetes bacterium]|nr:tetratricopeptide repeat protein [Armatimonadota bacterium]
MGRHCRIELLGQLKLRVGDVETTRFRTYKTGALLAYLAYHVGRPAPREELLEMLWPDTEDEKSRNSLSQSLSSLRHVLEPAGMQAGTVLEAGRHTVRLIEAACDTDTGEFWELVKIAKQAKVRGEDAAWASRAQQAVALFKGEFLPGIYEDWTLAAREGLREEALGLVEALIASAFSGGDFKGVLSLAHQGVVIDPTRETCHQAAIRAYDALGQPDAAVKQFRELERALWGQLGMKPSEASIAMVKQSLARGRDKPVDMVAPVVTTVPAGGTPTWVACEPALEIGQPARPGLWSFADPGSALEHAHLLLKSEPEAHIALMTGAVADALSAAMASPGQILCDAATDALLAGVFVNLGQHEGPLGAVRVFATRDTAGPISAPRAEGQTASQRLSRFFGRSEELESLRGLIVDPACRALTLTGPGGIGKTRLSVELANQVRADFPDGVWLVNLAETSDGNGIWDAVATSMGLVTTSRMTPQDQVLAAIGESRALFVLDNFEQICDSGGPETAATLVENCPKATLLVTSRRRLGIDGEAEFPLAPLERPSGGLDVAAIAQVPSVALFLDRARMAKPDFQLTEGNRGLIVDLCSRLEGIPLALELAASRVQVLSVSQILERIDQRLDLLASQSKVERHRTLRAAVDWSYTTLKPDQQVAFRRLGVFRGGWDIEAAEMVLDSPVALDVLAELRDFSLIGSHEDSTGRIRFTMLETIREYARMAASEEEWLGSRRAHAAAFLEMLAQFEPKLQGPEQEAVLNRMEEDRANIRAAVEFALESKDAEMAQRLAAHAWRFWHLKSHLDEGRALVGLSLQLEGSSPTTRARAMNGSGRLSYLQGDYETARAAHEGAISLVPDCADVVAMATNALGAVAYETGDYASAVRLFQECLAMRREQGDRFGEGNALSWLGIVLTDQSQFEEARTVLKESLVVRTAIGDTSGMARSLNSLGIVARRLGDHAGAADAYEKGLEIQRRLGDKRAIAGILSNLGMVAQSMGELDKARSLFNEALELNNDIGDKWGTATVVANQAALAVETGDLLAAASLNSKALRARSEMGNAWGLAYSFEGCAKTLLRMGKGLEAVRALAAAAKIRESVGSPLPPADSESVIADVEAARDELGAERFQDVWDSAQKLGDHELVDRCLEALKG